MGGGGGLVETYFTNIFTTLNSSGFEDVLNGVLPTFTSKMNSRLLQPYTAEEVHKALNQMAPLTALGPDGMLPIFNKSFWYIVGGDVTNAILTTLNSRFVPKSLNHTFIAFIPKIKDSKKVSVFALSICAMWSINLLPRCWLTI